MLTICGSATLDLLMTGLDHIPAFGRDEFALDNFVWCREPVRMVVGGNGANTAFVLGRLGVPVRLLSAVGDDALGAVMSSWLGEAGVDLTYLDRLPGVATSTTAVLSDETFHRVAFHHAGANARYGATGLSAEALAGTHALLLTGFPLMQALRGRGYRQMLAQARTLGALVAVDIGPAIGTPAGLPELAELLPLVDLLIANEHELAVATGVASPEGQLAAMLAAGAGTVVVKRGAAGVRLCRSGHLVDTPAFPVAAVQTVGAGDAFNAGLLAALAEGRSLEDAARFGNAVAACVVRAPAGIMAAPGRAEVDAMVAGASYRDEQ